MGWMPLPPVVINSLAIAGIRKEVLKRYAGGGEFQSVPANSRSTALRGLSGGPSPATGSRSSPTPPTLPRSLAAGVVRDTSHDPRQGGRGDRHRAGGDGPDSAARDFLPTGSIRPRACERMKGTQFCPFVVRDGPAPPHRRPAVLREGRVRPATISTNSWSNGQNRHSGRCCGHPSAAREAWITRHNGLPPRDRQSYSPVTPGIKAFPSRKVSTR